MLVKTSELVGKALDWAVAKIEFPSPDYDDGDREVYVLGDDEFHFSPSTNWSQGGLIIEYDVINIRVDLLEGWVADSIIEGGESCSGATPLIAAMRWYVASKLGNTVDVPDELL